MSELLISMIVGFSPELLVNEQLGFLGFLFFKYMILFSALMCLASLNPIHSVLYLMLAFVFSACLIMCIGAEFLGILLIMVYVGAMAVLFLFVVMMLNMDQHDLTMKYFFSYFLSASLTSLWVAKLFTVYMYNGFSTVGRFGYLSVLYLPFSFDYAEWVDYFFARDNVIMLGSQLYTYYFHLLMISGFMLLLAMVASILLTLMPKTNERMIRYQDKYAQMSSKANQVILLSHWSSSK